MREYIVSENGERTRVLLDVEEHERLLEATEELEDIAAYEEAKAVIEREGRVHTSGTGHAGDQGR